MSRKPGTVSEETRARLVEAATEEFSTVGYQKASLRTICSKAGVTTGALYFFFKGKDDLLQQVITPLCEEVLSYLEANFGSDALDEGKGYFSSEKEAIAAAEGLYELTCRKPAVTSIILKNRGHDAVEAFLADIAVCRENYLVALIGRLCPELLDTPYCDRYILQWYAQVQVDAFLGLYQGALGDEHARVQIELMIRSFRQNIASVLEREI